VANRQAAKGKECAGGRKGRAADDTANRPDRQRIDSESALPKAPWGGQAAGQGGSNQDPECHANRD